MKFSGKTDLIYNFLKENEGITSMQAFELFGATRLSDVIYRLKKAGCIIEMDKIKSKDRYGKPCVYGFYKYIGEPANGL